MADNLSVFLSNQRGPDVSAAPQGIDKTSFGILAESDTVDMANCFVVSGGFGADHERCLPLVALARHDRLRRVIEQIVFARNYTIGLLDQTPMTDWFRSSADGVSHVAWQVGHIAFSEYRLAQTGSQVAGKPGSKMKYEMLSRWTSTWA